MSALAEAIADTGDHPLAGSFCPGRHRAPWAVARVRSDAMAGLRQTFAPPPRGAHRARVVRLLTLDELLAADRLVTDLDNQLRDDARGSWVPREYWAAIFALEEEPGPELVGWWRRVVRLWTCGPRS